MIFSKLYQLVLHYVYVKYVYLHLYIPFIVLSHERKKFIIGFMIFTREEHTVDVFQTNIKKLEG